jgi:hypothetical protein
VAWGRFRFRYHLHVDDPVSDSLRCGNEGMNCVLIELAYRYTYINGYVETVIPQELHDLWRVRTRAWMINGDFNLIYHVEDKNNCRLNHRLMGQFHRFLNVAELKEAFLDGQLFTWCSERSHPTLEKIDRVFFTNEWEAIYTQHYLHSLPLLCSDHAPLLSKTDDSHAAKRRFHNCTPRV